MQISDIAVSDVVEVEFLDNTTQLGKVTYIEDGHIGIRQIGIGHVHHADFLIEDIGKAINLTKRVWR